MQKINRQPFSFGDVKMSFVNLPNDVKFMIEDLKFVKEYNGKLFTSTSHAGVLKQVEQHKKVLEERKLQSEDMIMAVEINRGSTVYYNSETKHIYTINEHGNYDRVNIDGSMSFCLRKNFHRVLDIKDNIEMIEKQRSEGYNMIQEYRKEIKGYRLSVKHYKKGVDL